MKNFNFDFHKLLRFDARTLALIEAARDGAYSRGYMDGGKGAFELADAEQKRVRRK
jgi:hypothetical protein